MIVIHSFFDIFKNCSIMKLPKKCKKNNGSWSNDGEFFFFARLNSAVTYEINYLVLAVLFERLIYKKD